MTWRAQLHHNNVLPADDETSQPGPVSGRHDRFRDRRGRVA